MKEKVGIEIRIGLPILSSSEFSENLIQSIPVVLTATNSSGDFHYALQSECR